MEGRIKFSQIPEVVSEVIQAFQGKSFPTLEEILAIDAEARLQAQACMGRRG